jgi:hypothetical protein
MARSAVIPWQKKDVISRTTADMLRTIARNGCPRHDVRRRLPPFRRQLQGCPAVSSHQGLQQGRGGLHPVCPKHNMRRDPRFRAKERAMGLTHMSRKFLKEAEGGDAKKH